MINLIKFRRSGLWLLSFIVALLVLSPSAGAWNYYLWGDTPGWSNNDSYKFSSTDNKVYTLTLSSLSGGFKIHNGDNSRDEYFSAGATAVQLESEKNYQMYRGGEKNDMSLPEGATNITITLYDDGGYNGTENDGYPDSIVIKYTIPATPKTWYLRGKFPKTNESSSIEHWGSGDGVSMGSSGTYIFGQVTEECYAEFKFSSSGTEWKDDKGAPNDDAIPDTGGEITSFKDKNFKITLKPGCRYKLTFTGSKLTVSVAGPYYLKGDFDNWGDGVLFTFDDITSNKLTAVVSKWNSSDELKINKGTNYYRYATKTNLENGTTYDLTEAAGNNMLASSSNDKEVTFTLTLNSSNVPQKINASWYEPIMAGIYGTWNDYSNTNDASLVHYDAWNEVDGWQVYEITAENTNDIQFKLAYGNSYFGPTGSVNKTVVRNQICDLTSTASMASTPWFMITKVKEGTTYTIRYKPETNKVQVTWPYENADAPHSYFLTGGFLNNWGKNDRLQFAPLNPDADVNTCKDWVVTAVYKESNSGNKGFKITNKRTADNGTWYSVGTTIAAPATGLDITKTETANMLLAESALGKLVTYTLHLDNNYNPATLDVSWDPSNPVTVTNDMPVYPIGIYNDNTFKRYDQWPVLYLQSTVLNNNRITPEYQMNKISDTRYELEFTLRNTKTEGDNWGATEYPLSLVAFENSSSPSVTYVSDRIITLNKTQSNEGARYKAIYEQAIDGEWTLSFEPVGDENDLPFLSMIGEDWVQHDEYKTPFSNFSLKTTADGWQEAWVQYDDRGNVRKDRKGRLMYNTFWPPRNPISFKTNFKVGNDDTDFTLTSKDLTFKKIGTKTGKEWKEEFKDRGVTGADLGYVYTQFKPELKDKVLALNDNTKYTLYQVEDMWINGNVKLWSGWGGVYSKDSGKDDSDAIANWSWHTNWGNFNQNVRERQDDGTYTGIFEVGPNQTVPLANKNGDMYFQEPTFFKYVSFFYDTTHPCTEYDDKGNVKNHGGSVLFTERAIGGAQIAALSTRNPEDNTTPEAERTDYEVGNYQASLSYLQNLLGSALKSVNIKSYATTTNGDNEVEDIVGDVFNWEATDSDSKHNENFYQVFNSESGNSKLAGDGSYDSAKGTSKSKWVKDPTDYVPGDYFYRMTVVLTDNDNKTHTITVDSNPFTIVKKEKLTLNVYQLVKLGDEEKDGVRVGEYVTFRGTTANPNKPVLPAYKVTIKNDNKFDVDGDNVEFDEDGNMLVGYIDDTNYEFDYTPLDVLPDYKSANVQFTDKVMIMGSIPSSNNIEGYAYGAEDVAKQNNGPKKAAITEEYDQSCQRSEKGDRFIHVTNVGSFEKRNFSLKMKYTTLVYDEEGNVEEKIYYTDPVTAVYTVMVPEPILKEAKIQVFYGTNDKTTTDDARQPFKFRDLNFNARYHSVREYLEVELPNVSTFMQERLTQNEFFKIYMDNSKIDSEDDETTSIYDYGFQKYDPDTNIAIYTGEVLHPTYFDDKKRTVKLDPISDNLYTRGWQDMDITPISVTDNAPEGLNHEMSTSLYYDENGKLISKIKINLKHVSGYDPEKTMDEENPDTDPHNYVFHEGKDDLHEHLHHHSANDYYYVTLVDRRQIPKKDENGIDIDPKKVDTEPYIITDKYEVNENIVSDDSFEYNGGLVTILDPKNPDKVRMLIPAKALMDGNSVDLNFTKNYGHYYDGQLEAVSPAFNDYVKNLRVETSYLYPFAGAMTPTTQTTDKPGIQRVVSDYNTNVLKSLAATADFSDITTSVTDIYGNDLGKVYSGVGFIEVEGNGVEIYGADGVKIATGEGRHEVNAGVYVVRVNGRTQKVIVR